jgi:integrase
MPGSIRERSPGVWQLRVFVGRDELGKPKHQTRTVRGGKRVAERELARFLTEMSDGKVSKPGTETVGEFLDRWLAQVSSHRSPTTVRGYKSHIAQTKAQIGSVRLDKLTAQHLDQAYSAWLNAGKSMGTVRHRHNVIGAALAQAVKWGVLAVDVSDKASPPPLRTRAIPRVRPEAVQRFIRAAEEKNPTLVAAIALAAVLGARRGELCGLKWSDIEEERILTIERSAKKDLAGELQMGDTKNHQARHLALDVFALAVLRQHKEAMAAQAALFGTRLEPDSFVLTPPIRSKSFDPSGKTPLNPDYITHAHRKLADALGIRVRFHDLRHFAATELVAAKIDPKTVAARLGHDPQVLMKTYAALVAENDQEAADVMGQVLSRGAIKAGGS